MQTAFGDIESMSSFSELLIFLFLEDVKLLSLCTSEALGSWAGDGGLGEGKPVGNMKKEILNQIANLLMLRSRMADAVYSSVSVGKSPTERLRVRTRGKEDQLRSVAPLGPFSVLVIASRGKMVEYCFLSRNRTLSQSLPNAQVLFLDGLC